MSTNCIITLDHPNDVYNSGDTLNGHVNLQTEKSKSIRGISITIVGYGNVSWSEGGGKHSKHYTAHEKYLNSVTYVVGSAEGDSFDFAPGIYQYTFSCVLRKELLTSLKERFGKVKYQVIVTINRRLRFDNVFKKIFTVNHIADLNDISSNKLPRHSNIEKEISPLFGCCCCCNGKIRSELKIPCGGYVSGQEIIFQLNIFNDSNIDLPGGRIKLRKCTTFISSEPVEKQKEVPLNIIVRNLETIPRQSHKEITGSFLVPYLVPTQRSQNIRVDYTLKAKIPLGCYSIRKFCIEVPVTVGSIPLTNDGTTYSFSNNNSSDIVPVNYFNIPSMNTNSEYEIKPNNSFSANYSANSVNPQDVTVIKSTGGVLNKQSTMTYGWS